MSKRHKIFSIFLSLFFIAFIANSQEGADSIHEFNDTVSLSKKLSKKAIEPYKYDGSKASYFIYNSAEKIKEIEMILFSGMEYRFAFNGKALPQEIKIQIYDKGKTVESRYLLKELKCNSGKSKVVQSEDLNKSYMSQTGGKRKLQKIYIDYVIPPSTQKNTETEAKERGAVVLTTGYEY